MRDESGNEDKVMVKQNRMYLLEDWADENVRPQHPLMVGVMSIWVFRKVEPQGSCNRASGLGGVPESSVDVWQQDIS